LDEIIFTPTTKRPVRDFQIPEFKDIDQEKEDLQITMNTIKNNYEAFGLRKKEDIDTLVDAGFELYDFINADLESKGFLLADTKWEFGYFSDGTLGLIDGCVTSDSSRFWNKKEYKFDSNKNEFSILQGDKQPFRDYIERLGLHENKAALAEHWIDDQVIREGVIRYCNMRKIITGTQTNITAHPKKRLILETLRNKSYLN